MGAVSRSRERSSLDRRRADPLIVTRLQYKTRTSFSDNRRTHVFVVDAAEHATPKPLTVGDFDNHSNRLGRRRF